MRHELPNSEVTYAASSLQFQKRAYYCDGSNGPCPPNSQPIQGWNHVVYDANASYQPSQGESAPVQDSQFYTWFNTQWTVVTYDSNGNPQTTNGHEMRLVPSDPEEAADKNSDGGQLPAFGQGPQAGSGNSFWHLKAYAGYGQCENPQRTHAWLDVFPSTGAASGTHYHDCMHIGIHLFDMDKRVANLTALAGLMQGINDWLSAAMNQPGMASFVKDSLKIGFAGPSLSWFYSIAQSGDAFHFNVDEQDFHVKISKVVDGYIPKTVISMVPPLIGWSLPLDPQLPGHWLPSVQWGDSVTEGS